MPLLLTVRAQLLSTSPPALQDNGMLELNFPSAGSSEELKSRLAALWGLEPDLLDLHIGEELLQSSDILEKYWDPGTPQVLVQAAVSMQALLRFLQSQNPRLRLVSLKALTRLPPMCSDDAQDAALGSLRDANVDVRRTALTMLEQLTSERGNSRVVSAVRSCFEDPSVDVQRAAISAAASLASSEDEGMTNALSQMLADSSKCVRRDAVEALTTLVSGSSSVKQVLAAISKHLRSADAEVRAQAVQAMARFASKGDSDTLEVFSELLQDPHPTVQTAALEGLACLSETGDHDVHNAISSFLESLPKPGLGALVATALASLGKVAARGDTSTITVTVGFLTHPGACVRRAAIEALAHLAKGLGDSAVNAALSPCLEDLDVSVRQAAVDALAHVSEKGAPDTVAGVVSKLDHPKADIRMAAVQALPNVVQGGDASSIEILCRCLEDMHVHVRRAAVDSLAQVAGRGNEQVITGALARLKHKKAFARRAALETLSRVAPRGNSQVVAAACRRLCDRDEGVALAAADVLAAVAGVEPWLEDASPNAKKGGC